MGTYYACPEWMGHGGKTWGAHKDGLGVDTGPVAEGCSSFGPPVQKTHEEPFLSTVVFFFYLRFGGEHYVLATIGGKNSKYLLEFGY